MEAFNLLFSVLCIGATAFMVAGGILQLIVVGSFMAFVIDIYLILFGVAAFAMEVFMPAFIRKYIGFYTTWVGKAMFFIFFGVLLLLPLNWFAYLSGIYTIALGFILILIQVLAVCQFHGHNTANSIIKGEDSAV
eukprot:TRINITY_DN1790_c0_g1_i1.p2 TRINITY_DN1790_c0_g1~~TRINITY_DN1790_c0_g1_i1.p2  ORF type:complete len:135 (-),score=24.87 TRINITY_DN1790_c0_g1_i1:109-513(-)